MTRLSAIVLLLAGVWQVGPALSGFEELSAAVTYCRSHPKTVTLKDDQSVLCFDGPIVKGQDDAAFHALKERGLFVVRSPGGHSPAAIRMANILRDKEATVVIYDYCFSACANYFLVASVATFVMKRTVVAWHGDGFWASCDGETIQIIRGERRGGAVPVTAELQEKCDAIRQHNSFFKHRSIDDKHIHEPPSRDIRQRFYLTMSQGGQGRSIFWMWHPSNHRDHFKIPITYEAYPASQEEVDEILRSAGFRAQVFYDLPRYRF